MTATICSSFIIFCCRCVDTWHRGVARN